MFKFFKRKALHLDDLVLSSQDDLELQALTKRQRIAISNLMVILKFTHPEDRIRSAAEIVRIDFMKKSKHPNNLIPDEEDKRVEKKKEAPDYIPRIDSA